jgi:hypothetical protein
MKRAYNFGQLQRDFTAAFGPVQMRGLMLMAAQDEPEPHTDHPLRHPEWLFDEACVALDAGMDYIVTLRIVEKPGKGYVVMMDRKESRRLGDHSHARLLLDAEFLASADAAMLAARERTNG